MGLKIRGLYFISHFILSLSVTNETSNLFPQESNVKRFGSLVGAPDSFIPVLFGGLLGSLFSFLQFVASPIIGGLSDRFRPQFLLSFVYTFIFIKGDP